MRRLNLKGFATWRRAKFSQEPDPVEEAQAATGIIEQLQLIAARGTAVLIWTTVSARAPLKHQNRSSS